MTDPTDTKDFSAQDEGVGGPGPADSDAASSGGELEQGRMNLLDHLTALRKCLVRTVIAVMIGFLAVYAWAMEMFQILMKPMTDVLSKVEESAPTFTPEFFAALKESLGTGLAEKGEAITNQIGPFVDALQTSLLKVVVHKGQFIYTYPPEAFFAELKVAMVAGFFLVSPYIFYQVWSFVAPGLYSHERRWIVPIAMVSAMFFVGGALFGYFQVFPLGFEFFAKYSSETINFTPKLSEYLGFALKLLVAFGVVFELPVFIFFLARMGLVTAKGLLTKGKYAVLIAFVVAAVLTPPDPVSQSMMAGPIILLYFVGVVVAWLFGKKKKEPKPEDGAEA